MTSMHGPLLNREHRQRDGFSKKRLALWAFAAGAINYGLGVALDQFSGPSSLGFEPVRMPAPSQWHGQPVAAERRILPQLVVPSVHDVMRRVLQPRDPTCASDSDSRLASVPERLSETLLDLAYYVNAPRSQPWRVSVYNGVADDGDGDIALGLRVLQDLQQHLPASSFQLVTNEPDRVKAFAEGSHYESLAQQVVHVDTYRDVPQLIVQAPAWPDEGLIELYDAPNNAPLLGVTEYSHNRPRVVTNATLLTGFLPDEAGIFVDNEIIDAGHALDRNTADNEPLRAASIESLAEHLGDDFLGGRTGLDYDATTQLHLVYAHGRQSIFSAVRTAIQMHGDTPANLDIVVLKHWMSRVECWRTAWQAQKWFKNMTIDGRSYDSSAPTANYTLRVMSRSALPHQAFRLGMALADFAVVTGDQSFSEVLASGTPFVYDTRPHKEDVMDGLAEQACHQHPSLRKVVEAAAFSWQSEQVSALYPWLKHGIYRSALEHVVRTNDVTPRLVGRALRHLTRQTHPNLPRLLELEDQVRRGAASAQGPDDYAELASGVRALGGALVAKAT